MVQCFHLEGADSGRLRAINILETPVQFTQCPVVQDHRILNRAGELQLEVKHSKRDEWIIAPLFPSALVVHARLLDEFDRRGFTGYRPRPVPVRFRDGYLSNEYSELVVTGWAGVAPPESGIRLIHSCTGCGYKKYTDLERPEKLIDWSQWTGEDFFIVWPLPGFRWITPRVAAALAELRVKSYRVKSLPDAVQLKGTGFSAGPLSNFLPEDLAIQYGKPLGLECEPGCYPPGPPSNGNKVSTACPVSFPDAEKMDAIREIYNRVRDNDGPAREEALASMIACTQDEELKFDVFHRSLNLLQKGKLMPEEFVPYVPVVLAQWDLAYAELKPRQQDAGIEWMLEEEYSGTRNLGSILLDLAGYIPADELGRILEEAMTLEDPRLKAFAIVSLLRRGEKVDPDQIERVAASLEVRMTLLTLLRDAGWEGLMPRIWTRPDVLAASDLCGWAAHGCELGAPPEEVELMDRFYIDSDEREPDEVYLFRFREYPKPWEPGEGWMAGIAGPIRNGESHDSPWSSFKRWDSMSPEEHFEQLYYRGSACAAD